VFSHRDSSPVQLDFGGSTDASLPWTALANNPLAETISRRLSPELRGYLKGKLPGHMIPGAVMVLDRFPLMPSGKIDRGALPQPAVGVARSGEHVLPRTSTEAAVQQVWADVLSVEQPGLEDNFFALGGHSLKATEVVSRLQGQRCNVSLRDIFTYPSIAELAASIDRRGTSAELESIPHTADAEHYPVSPAQRRLWVLAQIGGSAAYNMADSIRVRGPLNLNALEAATEALFRRHETLRTSFVEIGGELRQRVVDSVDTVLALSDLSGRADPFHEVRAYALEHARATHDLGKAPLLRIAVVKLAENDHVLLFNMHHIISDGWSLDVLIRELMTVYAAALAGKPDPLPPLRVQLRDCVLWQSERRNRQAPGDRQYWLQQLHDAPFALDLPTDFPRPPVKTYAGGRCRAVLPREVGDGLKCLAQTYGATLSMVLTALVKILLFRYSGQSDISVGCPVAGRVHPDLENQLGFYVNTLVLRDQLESQQRFVDFLAEVRETVVGALAYQEYPFDQVVQDVNPPRDPSRNPLFDVMVALQNTANKTLRLPHLEISSLGIDYGLTQFDMLWSFTDTADLLYVELQYNSDLFLPETAKALMHHWQTLSDAAIANPRSPIGKLPLLTSEERGALIAAAETRIAPTKYASVVEWFEAWAAQTPDAVAITDGPRHLTYAELNARANGVARAIQARLEEASTHEPLIGICMRRSIEQVIGILAILKAGGSYVPLDPDAPVARLRFIVEDSRVALLVTDNSTPSVRGAAEYLLTDEIAAAVADENNLGLRNQPSAAAYVIYTSGSTGEPKGAIISHGNVARLFTSTEHWFGFGPQDVWTLFHSYAFDFSVWEIWGALRYGGRLVVVPYETSRDPDEFYRLLSNERVTILNQTPSAFRQLMQADVAQLHTLPLDLRYVIFGGEALLPASLRPWIDRHGDQHPKLINMYGITETTVHVTYRPVRMDDIGRSVSPIGQAIPDLRLYVLDENMEPVPDGFLGELFVGGEGLARGYLRRDTLTAQRFLADPFHPEERLYRTGDRVRRNLNGELEYLGRLDQQVKIRGHRIETGEIAAVISRFDGIGEVVVRVRERNGNQALFAYYVCSNGNVSTSALRRHLEAQLPAYMIPEAITPLARLPLTVNGKLDERALAELEHGFYASRKGNYRPARSGLEREIVDMWRSLLGQKQLGPDDNVFEHGAHSMLAVQARNQLQNRLCREVPVVLLFQYPTPGSLAVYLEGEASEEDELVSQRASRRLRASRQQRRRWKRGDNNEG
jgi:amino acid adenylation domain-containing protein